MTPESRVDERIADERIAAARRERQRDLLWTALFENSCGDPDCEGLRVEAALFVLRGGSTHKAYAELVNRAAAKRPLLALPLSPEAVSAIRERFAALPLGDELREGGLMLVEMLASTPSQPPSPKPNERPALDPEVT